MTPAPSPAEKPRLLHGLNAAPGLPRPRSEKRTGRARETPQRRPISLRLPPGIAERRPSRPGARKSAGRIPGKGAHIFPMTERLVKPLRRGSLVVPPTCGVRRSPPGHAPPLPGLPAARGRKRILPPGKPFPAALAPARGGKRAGRPKFFRAAFVRWENSVPEKAKSYFCRRLRA